MRESGLDASVCAQPPLAFPLSCVKTNPMRETPPEDEKPKSNWFTSKPKLPSRPDSKPKPRGGQDRDRKDRDRKPVVDRRPQGRPTSAKKANNGWCGCIALLALIGGIVGLVRWLAA
jgi:hypothetical protein